jgi:hypothetical protein
MSETAALILAGGTITPELAALAPGVTNRALIPLAPGRVMLDYVVDAVRPNRDAPPIEIACAAGANVPLDLVAASPQSREAPPAQSESPLSRSAGRGGRVSESFAFGPVREIRRVLVAGDVPPPPGCFPVAGGGSLVDTLINGVAALASSETQLILITADLPFLTPEAVADFVERAEQVQPADIVFSIVPAAVCAERFPTMRRTTLRIREGEFTLGGLSRISPGFVRDREAVIREAYARRKDKVRLAAMLGPGLMLRFALAQILPRALTIPYLEREVGRLLGGARARAVISPFAGVGVDVDKPEDVEIARAELSAGTVKPPSG